MINPTYIEFFKDEAKTREFVETILTDGLASLPDFLTKEMFEALILYTRDPSHKGKKREELDGTIAGDLMYSPELLEICDAIHRARCKIEDKAYIPLRVEKQRIGFPHKDAKEGKETKRTEYHFDGAYINGIVPLILPEDQESQGGKLVYFPNIRTKYPYPLNGIVTRLLRHSKLFRKLYGEKTLPYEVGHLHVFFGDVTFHGVEPITGGERLVMTINNHW